MEPFAGFFWLSSGRALSILGWTLKGRVLFLVAALVAVPAVAEDVSFKGRTLEVASDQENPPILRMSGTQYVLPRSQEQLVNQAQACLTGTNGVTVESADVASGVLVAHVDNPFRASFTDQVLRSRLEMVASEGAFQITETELSLGKADEAGSMVFAPLLREGSWEKGLDLLVQAENKLVDCLYK